MGIEGDLEAFGNPNLEQFVIITLGQDENYSWQIFTGIGGDRFRNRYFDIGSIPGYGTSISMETYDPNSTPSIVQLSKRDWHFASNTDEIKGISQALTRGILMECIEIPDNEHPGKEITVAVNPLRNIAIIRNSAPNSQSDNPFKVQYLYCRQNFDSRCGLEIKPGEAYYMAIHAEEKDTDLQLRKILLPDNATDYIWEALNPATRVALACKEIQRGSEKHLYTARSIYPNHTFSSVRL